VRATIELGERIFPRAATVQSMKSINSFKRPWYETAGLHQTNKMLRGGQQVEYEVFLPGPTCETGCTENYPEDWKRPMHWAGFLVVGASTQLHDHTIVETAGGFNSGGGRDVSVTTANPSTSSTPPPSSSGGVMGWTSKDVAKYVSGLTEDFGQKASVYGAAMVREDIDGQALLDLKSDSES